MVTRSSTTGDVIVVGGGIIGLSVARELARRGARVLLSMPELPGGASSAAAGVLGPTIEAPLGAARTLAIASRDLYPGFCAALREETGIDPHLSLTGVLRLAAAQDDEAPLRREESPDAHWIGPAEVRHLEPHLSREITGALFHHRDGMVANERLHSALRSSARGHRSVQCSVVAVEQVRVSLQHVTATLLDGRSWTAGRAVIAAGAWSPLISGLPRRLQVEPIRGQMVSVVGRGITRPVYGFGGYLVPRRDGRVWVGSTLERVGYSPQTTPVEVERLFQTAHRLVPSSVKHPMLSSWAGLRPVTADGLPILGPDPAFPRLIFACGHSRNGILLAPLTAQVAADLVGGRTPAHDLTPYRPGRFDG